VSSVTAVPDKFAGVRLVTCANLTSGDGIDPRTGLVDREPCVGPGLRSLQARS
jgi:hypothetical protein